MLIRILLSQRSSQGHLFSSHRYSLRQSTSNNEDERRVKKLDPCGPEFLSLYRKRNQYSNKYAFFVKVNSHLKCMFLY